MAKKRPVGDTIALQDKRLIDLAANGLSPEEIEKQTGVPGAEVVVRIRDILRSRDIWTDLERRQLLLHSAHKLKDKVERFLQADDPKSVQMYLNTLKVVSDMLDKQGTISDDEIQQVTRAQAGAMMQMIEAGYGRARELLSEEYPNVDMAMIDMAFKEGLREAVTADD